MTTSQFFVYKRPIAWTALALTLAWGVLSYLVMPQRHDPIIPVRMGVVVTPYPGARAEKVEQEVTRKIERKLGENAAVETVSSLSRSGLSVVYVQLSESEKNAAQVWQDLQGRLDGLNDLPRVGERPVQPVLDKDYGDTVAVMLTISSPPVADLEIELRAQNIRAVLEPARAACAPEFRDGRVSGVLVYPNTVARASVLRIGRTLLQRLAEAGVARDGRVLEAASTGCIDFQLVASVSELRQVLGRWARETQASGQWHHDVWPPFLVGNLDELPWYLRANAREKYTYRELRDFADRIQDHLKRFPTVALVRQIGVQDEQVTLSYSGQRFTQFGIRPDLILSRLQQRNINLPGGRVELPEQNLVVQPSGEFKSEREIGDVVITLAVPPMAEPPGLAPTEGGYPLYVRDLADITRGYVDPPDVMNFRTIKVSAGQGKAQRPKYHFVTEPGAVNSVSSTARQEPRPPGGAAELQTTRAITLDIRQVKGSHGEAFARDIDRALAELQGVLPDDLRIERTSDEPATVRRKVREFNQCLLEAVVIVVLIALVLMEWRSAVLVAISIPVTVAMTLGMCQMLGLDIQQISIGALIIALGLLIDDPVVASDAINRELADGVPRDVAAWQGPQKLARAILYATLTNCVAFLPLLLVGGAIGEFIYSLPVVVTASLVASRVVSMTFMPLLGSYLLRGQRGFDAEPAAGGSLAQRVFRRAARGFSRFTAWSLDHKWTVLTVFDVFLVVCLFATRFIGSSFFPKDLHSVFAVDVFLPEGSPMGETLAETERILERIEALEGLQIESYTTFVGAGGPRFWLSVAPEPRADNYAQILVHTRDRRQTGLIVARLKRALPPEVAAARVTVRQLETGPPIGVPVQVRLIGPDIEQLRVLAAQVEERLRGIPGSDNVHDDWDPEILQLSLDIDPERAGITGITNQDVAGVVSAGLSGYPITQMRERNHVVDVRLRLRSDERSGINDLYNLYIVSALTNARVPLLAIARFKTELVSPKIWRRDYQRCLTVKCDALPGVLPSRLVAQFRPQLAGLDWPPGYRYEFGGEQEEQSKEFRKVARALLFSLLAIYLALVLQFNSSVRPLIVFAAVPFGLVGGLMGLLVFGAPFGFMAFLGVASLAGVIVSHIIVLFEYIEDMRQQGRPFREAIIAATLARLRPVLVTVLATVGGLIPLAVRGGPLWEPMCYVQIFGLLIATTVTLIAVPAIYAVFVETFHLVRWEVPRGVNRS
jgi:multidrug efflux pump subunit AcrB